MLRFCVLFNAFVAILAANFEKYPTKYDNIDIDQILNSERLFGSYVQCVLDKGPCSPDGKDLKKYLPDVLETNCIKCSERQKEIYGKIIKHLINNKPDLWQQLKRRYDSDGVHFTKYEQQFKAFKA